MKRYFFFGTLMDRDVLSMVIGRRVGMNELTSAKLSGYRRVRIANGDYPMLIESPSNSVTGTLFESETEEEDDRILFFEDYDYDLLPCRVTLFSGLEIDALFCGAEEGKIDASSTDWHLEEWATRSKNTFLAVSRIYMRCFGRMTPDQAETVWLEACHAHGLEPG